jgi:hypothetical protein
MTALWDIAPCSFVEVDRRFRGEYSLHLQGGGGSTHLKRLFISMKLHDANSQKTLNFILATVGTRNLICPWAKRGLSLWRDWRRSQLTEHSKTWRVKTWRFGWNIVCVVTVIIIFLFLLKTIERVVPVPLHPLNYGSLLLLLLLHFIYLCLWMYY